MLDEAVRGKHGGDRKSESIKLYNVQLDKPPSGNTRASGLRKLQKYAQERPDVAEVFEKVLTGEVSVNKPLLDTGLRKVPVTRSQPSPQVKWVWSKPVGRR
jgi:hypothetical protein